MNKIKQTKVLGVPLKADEKVVDDYNAAVDRIRQSWHRLLIAFHLRKVS